MYVKYTSFFDKNNVNTWFEKKSNNKNDDMLLNSVFIKMLLTTCIHIIAIQLPHWHVYLFADTKIGDCLIEAGTMFAWLFCAK